MFQFVNISFLTSLVLVRVKSLSGIFQPRRLLRCLVRHNATATRTKKSPFFKTKLVQLKSEIDSLVFCILRHLPDTVEGFDRFFSPGSADEGGRAATASTSSNAAAKSSLSSTIARGVSVAGGGWGATATARRSAHKTLGMGIILVQEMLEPELAGLQPRHCAGPLAQVISRISSPRLIPSQVRDMAVCGRVTRRQRP